MVPGQRFSRLAFLGRLSYRSYFFVLVFFLILYLGYEVGFNPENGFLKPTLHGQWILAPRSLTGGGENACHAAVFRKEIHLPPDAHWTSPVRVTITAARAYRFHVNDRLVSVPDQAVLSRNWKLSQTFDISEALHGGANVLALAVENSNRVPAVHVDGGLSLDSGVSLRFDTDLSWRVRSADADNWTDPEPVVRAQDFYPGHLATSPLSQPSSKFLRVAASLTVYVLIGLAIYLYKSRGRESLRTENPDIAVSRDAGEPRTGRVRQRVAVVLLFAALFLPMAVLRAPDSGWDAQAHIDYVRYVAQGRGVPLADQGWEMYQPPAYYFVAAGVYRLFLPLSNRASQPFRLPSPDFLALKVVQLMTPIFVLLQILIVKRTLRLIDRARRTSPIVLGFAVLLPMQIYASSFISNEVFSSLTISASLFLLVRIVGGNRFGVTPSLALGACLALSCLSKYTGLLMMVATSLVYLVFFLKKSVDGKKLAISFLAVAALVIGLAGPYYYRNWVHFGRPLPINQELSNCPSLGYSSLGFYIGPSLIGTGVLDKFVARTLSFPDGNYSSMWLDNSHKSRPWTRWFEVAIYYLAVFPTFLIAAGFCRCVAGLRADTAYSKACLPVVTIFVLAIFAYINFVLRISQFETVRAFYLLSQIIPLAVFLDVGTRSTACASRRRSVWNALTVVLYGAIILYYLLMPLIVGSGT